MTAEEIAMRITLCRFGLNKENTRNLKFYEDILLSASVHEPTLEEEWPLFSE